MQATKKNQRLKKRRKNWWSLDRSFRALFLWFQEARQENRARKKVLIFPINESVYSWALLEGMPRDWTWLCYTMMLLANIKPHSKKSHGTACFIPLRRAFLNNFTCLFKQQIIHLKEWQLPCLQKQLIPAKGVLCENDSYFKIQVFSIWKHIYCGFFMQNFSPFLKLV